MKNFTQTRSDKERHTHPILVVMVFGLAVVLLGRDLVAVELIAQFAEPAGDWYDARLPCTQRHRARHCDTQRRTVLKTMTHLTPQPNRQSLRRATTDDDQCRNLHATRGYLM